MSFDNKKTKILLYIDVMFRGGAQRVMSILANHFSQCGYEVVLVTDFIPFDISKEYKLSSSIRRFYLGKNNSGNFFKKNINRILKLRKIIKHECPDIILSFLGHPNLRMLISTIGIKSKKFVSVRNDPSKEYGSSFIKKTITNLIFMLADGYIFQTEDASKYFYKKIQKKSKIIFNPVDDVFYKILSQNSKKNIISIGRLEKQKNHKLLIDAFDIISKEYPNEKLLIYGEGTLKKELENYVKEKRLSNKIYFKGNVDNIANELSRCKLFVLSSDYEGMPNALMEAMAASVACISTDCPCGGPRALIKNDTQGILVSCNNVKKLAGAISSLLNDDNYLKLGENARERAKEFQTEKILKEWEDYLFKL